MLLLEINGVVETLLVCGNMDGPVGHASFFHLNVIFHRVFDTKKIFVKECVSHFP